MIAIKIIELQQICSEYRIQLTVKYELESERVTQYYPASCGYFQMKYLCLPVENCVLLFA